MMVNPFYSKDEMGSRSKKEKSRNSDGFVKSSPATGGTRRVKTEEGGALIASPQRFTPLDLLLRVFSSESKAFFTLPGGRDFYLTGQDCSVTPQVDLLRNHSGVQKSGGRESGYLWSIWQRGRKGLETVNRERCLKERKREKAGRGIFWILGPCPGTD
jgi:hypothetical protein